MNPQVKPISPREKLANPFPFVNSPPHRPSSDMQMPNDPSFLALDTDNQNSRWQPIKKIINYIKTFFANLKNYIFTGIDSLKKQAFNLTKKHLPKAVIFQRTLFPNRKNHESNYYTYLLDKSERHEANLEKGLESLKKCNEQDLIALTQQSISEKTHLLRYLQVLAIKLAYCLDFTLEPQIPLPCYSSDPGNPELGYSLGLEINYAGMVAYGLEPPKGSSAPRILLIKGTSSTNLYQLKADINPEIGSKSVSQNHPKIKEWINKNNKDLVIVGHSLGGTIAQIIATYFFSFIKMVVTFDAPSPGSFIVEQFEKLKNEEIKRAEQAQEKPHMPEVFNFTHQTFISYAGGPASISGHCLELQVDPKLNFRDRHNYLGKITEEILKTEKKPPRRRFLRVALEIIRWFGYFLFSYPLSFFAKKQTENREKIIPLKRRFSVADSNLKLFTKNPSRRFSE